MKPKLGIDVDGVLVNTITLYNDLAPTFKDPLDFWRNEFLYDNLLPMQGAVEKVEALSEHFNIVFVSRLKGNHHRSKVYWLKKYFPCMIGFVGSHEKWLMNDCLRAMIDDLPENLVKFDENKRVLFGGEYFPSWEDLNVDEFVKKYIGEKV